MAITSKKELKEAVAKWRSGPLRDRQPAGYEQHLRDVAAYESAQKAKSSESSSGSSSSTQPVKKKSSSSYTSNYKGGEAYEDSDEYERNEMMINRASKSKPQDLSINPKRKKGSSIGKANRNFIKNRFKGINNLKQPRQIKKPKIGKVKGYSKSYIKKLGNYTKEAGTITAPTIRGSNQLRINPDYSSD